MGEGGSNISNITSARISDLDARSPSRKRSDDAPDAVFQNCSGRGSTTNGVAVYCPPEYLPHIKLPGIYGHWYNCTGDTVFNGVNYFVTRSDDAGATHDMKTLGMNGERNHCDAGGAKTNTRSIGAPRVSNGGRIFHMDSRQK